MEIINSPKIPLTQSQLDIFLDQQRTPDSCRYNIGGYFQIIGALDTTRLISAVTAVIQAESAFHLQLDLSNDLPQQYLLPPESPTIAWLDFYQATSDKQTARAKAQEWLEQNFAVPFSLQTSLFQLAICKIAQDEHRLYLKAHHLIMDGWSYTLFIKRVVDHYSSDTRDTELLSSPGYWEFIQHKHQQSIAITAADNQQKVRAYWRERLANSPDHLLLQRSKSTLSDQSDHTSNRHQFVVSAADIAPLLAHSKQQNASAFHALLALIYCYFMRATGTHDLLIGTPLHKRNNARTKHIIGMLADTSPTRIQASPVSSYNELLTEIKQNLLRDFRHQEYSLGQIHRGVNNLNERRERLFDVFVSYENFAYQQSSLSGLQITPHPLTHRQDQTPFSLFIRQYATSGDFEFDLQLHSDFFSATDAHWIEGRLRHLIKLLAIQPDVELRQLSWLPEHELQALQTINRYAPVVKKYPHTLERFNQVIEKNLYKTAVIGSDKSLTYQQLDHASNAFAHWLTRQEITRGATIGVCMDRTSDLLVVLLGIWKAGAAYIPLDPQYPAARLQQVIEHSQLQWVITHSAYTSLFANLKISCCVFSPELINSNQHSPLKLATDYSLTDLAYVIYTSGSTGIPKGVAIEQGSVANFLTAMTSAPGITAESTLLAVTTISFDIHVLELFLPLLNGATLVLATSDQVRDAFALRELMQTHSVNIMQATPATWKMLFHADWQPDGNFKALCGGEALPPVLLEKFGQFPQVELWNMYGPTEATVWSSTAKIQHANNSEVHLGHPINNSYYVVLDALGYPAGFNLSGELYIGGHCLAREYIHDAEKTTASFIWHKLPGMEFQRIYKTGDSVELSDKHQLHFRSRNDDQVKVRGYRIELGDIETALMKHPRVKDAAVKIWRDARGENYLAAYCVANTTPVPSELLVNDLKHSLPEYMLPAAYTWLDALPLTANGKINRKVLVEPELNSQTGTQELPKSPLEQTIAALWSDLLAVKNPMRTDDFFHLGGDSISNIQLVNRLRKAGIAAEAADIFQHSRLMDFADLLASRLTNTNTATIGNRTLKLAGDNENSPFALSSAQQRLYILQQLESTETAYNMYGAFLISGPVNHSQLQVAFEQLLARHPVLSSRFYENQGELLQQFITADNFSLEQKLLSADVSENLSNWLPAAIRGFVRPFDLNHPPLVRAQLWLGEGQQHVLLIDMHHLVADGLSINIFLRDLFSLYEQYSLTPVRADYRHFIQQQTDWQQSPAWQQAGNYWHQQFSGTLPSLDFPTDYTRPPQQQFSGKRLSFSLSNSQSDAVRNLARQNNVSLFMLLLAAYNLLLAKYTGREDIVVGTPVSNRPNEQFDELVGLFVNTLPLRTYPSPTKYLPEFLQEIKTNVSQAFLHKHYPFEQLLDHLGLVRDLSRNPLFDCALVLQADALPEITTATLAVNPLPVAYQQAKFDLTLDAVDKGTHIHFDLEYASHLFNEQRIQSLGQHFIVLLQNMVEQPNAPLGALSLLSDAERYRLLHTFNNTEKYYPQHQTLTSIFEQQVVKTPEQIAVGFAEKSFSYCQLNAKANQLAHQLIAAGVSKNQIVAVMLERSLEMPVAILAIGKAGAAYLPIAPNLPPERIEYMLADSNAPVLITTTKDSTQATGFAGKILFLDDALQLTGPDTNPTAQCGPDDLAYIIYTSGSTGRPKGAMVEHRAVVNRIYWMQDKYPLTTSDVILQKTPYTFDVSVWELFWWSFAGASVYFIAPEAEKDPQQIFSCIDKQRISIMHFVPSMLTASLEFLAAHQNNNWTLNSLRYVFASGEALNPHQVEEFNHLIHPHSGAQLINLYGPTEAAIDVTYFDCPVNGKVKRVPIGKPIDNIRLHILDNQQQLVPLGIAGELYISGTGVGRGYINKPELTAEKFLADPFFPGQRMYRTGDLCRWLEDGNIEYLGRLDHQVKIRGFRIELGEIENALLMHTAVREATVTALQNNAGQNFLCAYLVARTSVTTEQLRQHLADSLPDYMVPAEFVLLEKMPLNPSGKVDRKQLPAPQITAQVSTKVIDDSQLSDSERSLLHIVRELLNNPQVGLDDNFFHSGGDSIRAIQLSARAAQQGFAITIRDIFKYPCIGQLAQHALRPALQPTSIHSPITGKIALTPIQQAFFEQRLTQPDAYCQYIILQTTRFTSSRLRQALNYLVQQHPLLNAKVIHTDANNFPHTYQLHIAEDVQRNWHGTQFIQRTIDLENGADIELELNRLLQDLHTSIRLDNALYAAGVLSTPAQDYLLISIHHVIIDGVSWRILLDDLNHYYHLNEGTPTTLLPSSTSPNEWISASKACAKTSYLQKQFTFWQATQQSIPAALLETTDEKKTEEIIDGSWQTESSSDCLSHTETLTLLTNAHTAYNTDTQDLLISAFALAWHQWTGKLRIALDLEAHGRHLPFDALDCSRSLGWFTAIFPWVIDLDRHAPLTHQLPQIKESLRRIPDKGIGFGLLKYFGTEAQQQQLRTNGPDVLFNYLGHLDSGNPDWQLHTTGLYSGPQNRRSHSIEITMAIKSGHLTWQIHYSGKQFSASRINKFNQLLRAQLLDIAAHCCLQPTALHTPSDLGDAHYSLETYLQLARRLKSQGPITAIRKLTPTQAGIYFHTQQQLFYKQPPDTQSSGKLLSDNLLSGKPSDQQRNELYYEELGLSLNQALDAELLQHALNQLTKKHSILRSLFIQEGTEEVRQIVCDNARTTLSVIDISALTASAQEEWISQQKHQLRTAGFDWKLPLLGLHVFKTGEQKSLLLFTYHHLILDGWSCAALIDELLRRYLQLQQPNLPSSVGQQITEEYSTTKPSADFGDYLAWLTEQNPEPARAFWRTHLAGIDDITRLPGEIAANNVGYSLQETEYQLPANYLQGLQQLAAHHEVTLNTLIQAAWGLLLQRYNNTDDALFVSVVSGRTAPVAGIEHMLGLFINSIPVRIAAPQFNQSSSATEDIQQWLCKLQDTHLQAEQNAFIGLADIASAASISSDLFRHLLVFENYPVQDRLSGSNLRIDKISLYEQTHYDFNLLVQPAEQLHFRFIVNSQAHPAASVARIAGHLLDLLRTWAERKEIVLPHTIINPAETLELITLGTVPALPVPSEENLIARFLQQRQLTPDVLAVCDSTTQISYAQLARQSHQIAQHLLALGIRHEQPVALLANRSCNMVAALLGILQSGAVVVPIDPHLPEERIHYLLADSTSACVLVDDIDTQLAQTRPGIKQYAISQWLAAPAIAVESIQLPVLSNAQLLYLIYTSGTTGTPKGVMLEQRNLLALIVSQTQQGLLPFNKQVLQFATHSFDVCYQEIFSTLLAGGCLHIIDEQLKKDADYLLEFIRTNTIDTVFLPTAYLKFLFSTPERIAQIPACVEHIITAGEQLLVSPHLRQFLQASKVLLHNHYGPSETHVVTTQVLSKQSDIADIPPIGKPINGTGIYLLDKHGKLQTRGALGEIFIGGASVGRGYWQKPALTQERFLTAGNFAALTENTYFSSNEFLALNGERIYRTGDLGYWSEAGELIYLGRGDQQIKVRGYRIEPAEIEACLRKQAGIHEAAVIAQRDRQGNNYLIAYLVLHTTTSADVALDTIKQALANELPVYMQPAFFVPLMQLPMTANGKMDKRALPAVTLATHSNAQKPASKIQIRLASFWQELLGIPEPHLESDFFAMGGHSLNAAALASRIQHEWHIPVSLKELFAARTLQQQAELITGKQAQTKETSKDSPTENTADKSLIVRTENYSGFIPGNWIPLSSAQQRLYVLDQLAGPTTNYNIPFVARIQPGIDLPQLENALQQLVERQGILRARIAIHDGQPMQTIVQDAVAIQHHAIAEEELDTYLANWVKPFVLHQQPLFRMELLDIESTQGHWLLLDLHHIIADGVSVEILLRELMALYNGETLAAVEYDYATYIDWQTHWQHTPNYQTQKHHWLNRFRQLPPALELPLDFIRPPERSTAGAEFSLPLDSALAHALENFAQQQSTSVFAVALTAYALWLWRYSGETDMAIGIPVSGRSLAEFANIPGLMVNSLALHIHLDAEQTAQACVHQMSAQLLDDLQHQDFPFDALVNALELPRNPGRNALFDTMFSLGSDWLSNAGAQELFIPHPLPVTEAKFDLAMSLDQRKGQYLLSVNYATSLFTAARATAMGHHYLIMLQQLLEHPQQPLRNLNCLSVTEYQQLTLDFNNTTMSYPRASTIALEFEKMAARYSEHLAVHDAEGTLTYRELNELANQMAACLIQLGPIQPGQSQQDQRQQDRVQQGLPKSELTPQIFVGVMLERSRYWIASMLAVLKAGAVYMPIAPDWPEERIRSILQDANAPLLICTPGTASELTTANCQKIYLDNLLADAKNYSAENIAPACSATDLAYTIYTSGSTGIPKGVLVEQRGVLNLAQWAGREYNLEHNTRMLQMTSPGFDVSIEETLVPLLNGAAVFILNDASKMDKKQFTHFVQQHRIQIVELVPSLLADYLLDNIAMDSLALVITGAERLDPLLKDQILARGYRLHNVYGPTETTVNATSKACSAGDDTIGKPMANSHALILDRLGRVQPIGVPGELCISGDNLARGYHQREALTAEKFTANPFVAGARLYRTGDLAAWTHTGEIRFIGRIDQQVKIRGYRIETGDIETRLMAIEGVQQAIVTVRNQDTANASLCAYYTSATALNHKALHTQLAQWLPEYMIPAQFIYLDAIPLTTNGKVDKKALPQPDSIIRTDYLPPRTPIEFQLAEIWCNLLGGSSYSIDEDFFRVGGHSLLAIKLLTSINQQWNILLKLTDIFTHSTLEQLASLITRHSEQRADHNLVSIYQLLNPVSEKNLFLFPPALGEAAIYARLSQQLPDYRFYCFNYLDNPQRLEIYADTIAAAQTQGAIYLFGYSAGGNLAFEVARVLEARGHRLGGLILLDSVRRKQTGQARPAAQITQDLQDAFARNHLSLDDSMLAPLVEQAYRYGLYMEELINSGFLQTPVHLIKADIPVDITGDYGWADASTHLYIHAGKGEHLELLAGPNLDHNTRLIAACLSEEAYIASTQIRALEIKEPELP